MVGEEVARPVVAPPSEVVQGRVTVMVSPSVVIGGRAAQIRPVVGEVVLAPPSEKRQSW